MTPIHPTSRVVVAFVLTAIGIACGTTADSPGDGSGDGGAIPTGIEDPNNGLTLGSEGGRGGPGDGPTCTGLQCQQQACVGGGTTTISGTVYDPAKKNPLYNVVVYVPNAPLAPLKAGASCDSCNSLYSGTPIATALTNAQGKFVLTNAPVGHGIPLVIQVGKWRKRITIDNVAACTDNPQPDKSLALPRNSQDGLDANIPDIAISTGGSDTLECLLARVGVDTKQYVPDVSTAGRIHIFAGTPYSQSIHELTNTSPAAKSAKTALWNSAESLKKYDIVLLSCEGEETVDANQQALHDYASAGGRVFASHFHYEWFIDGPYATENIASWTRGSTSDLTSSNNPNGIYTNIVTKSSNGKTLPKGQAMHDWLATVKAFDRNGELPIVGGRSNATVTSANTPSQAWIEGDSQSMPPNVLEYFSFNTPTNAATSDAGVPNYCGRVVYSDLHIGAAAADQPRLPIPEECVIADLSPQEKALEFMLFDLSSCVIPDTAPPAPPPPMGTIH